MYFTLINRKISTSIIAIGLTLLSLLVTVFFIVIFKVEDKTISIINFYEEPIKVKIKNLEYEIPAFDTKLLTLNISSGFLLDVKDLDGKQLNNIDVHDINRGSQLVTIALNPQKGYCFFQSEVIKDSEGNLKLSNKTIYNHEAKSYTIVDANTTFSDYVYPGKTLDINEFSFSRPIEYVYPISCNLVDNDQAIINTIKAFSDYNAADQLKYLHDIREKVTTSDNIDTLDQSIPGNVSKYYVSEKSYVLIYE